MVTVKAVTVSVSEHAAAWTEQHDIHADEAVMLTYLMLSMFLMNSMACLQM